MHAPQTMYITAENAKSALKKNQKYGENLMYESKREPGRKFGSAWRGAKFDSYSAGAQPKVESTPKEEGSSEADVAKAKSPATSFHFVHDHAGNKHTVTSTHEDG